MFRGRARTRSGVPYRQQRAGRTGRTGRPLGAPRGLPATWPPPRPMFSGRGRRERRERRERRGRSGRGRGPIPGLHELDMFQQGPPPLMWNQGNYVQGRGRARDRSRISHGQRMPLQAGRASPPPMPRFEGLGRGGPAQLGEEDDEEDDSWFENEVVESLQDMLEHVPEAPNPEIVANPQYLGAANQLDEFIAINPGLNPALRPAIPQILPAHQVQVFVPDEDLLAEVLDEPDQPHIDQNRGPG